MLIIKFSERELQSCLKCRSSWVLYELATSCWYLDLIWK
jgi:hypothetical protein